MIGSNVSAIGGLCKAIERAAEYGYDCTQVYTTNSRRWDVQLQSSIVADEIISYSKKKKVTLVSHIPFLVNLSSSNKQLHHKSIERLKIEIINAHLLGINKLVLHPGSSGGESKDTAIEKIMFGLNVVSKMCVKYGVMILLETMSGQGTQVGSKFEELRDIISNIHYPETLGVCFDTAHVFAAGMNISNVSKLKIILNDFDKCIGLGKIGCFHLNNTNVLCGKKIDRHSSIFNGQIQLEVFEYLVDTPQFSGIPKVLEPPASDDTGPKQVEYLKNSEKRKFYVG